MKKIISLLMCVTVLFSILSFKIEVFAQNPEVYVEDTEYLNTRTDTVLVPIKMGSLPADVLNGKGQYSSGIIHVNYPTDKLKFVNVKTGTMVGNSSQNSIVWKPQDNNGEITLVFVDDTADRSSSYGENSFEKDKRDVIVYLEFEMLTKTTGTRIPITLSSVDLGVDDVGIKIPPLVSNNNLTIQSGEIYITEMDTNLYITGFQLEVKNGTAYDKYPAVMDAVDKKTFTVVAKPDSNGIVEARVIPIITLPGAELEIKCPDSRVVISGNNITIPADIDLKSVDVFIRVVKADKTVIPFTTYKLTVIRGDLSVDVDVEQGVTAKVSEEEIISAVDVKPAIITGDNVKLVLDIKKDDQNQNSKSLIETVKGSQQLAGIFEITLKKVVNGTQVTAISETQKTISISIELPENMRNGKDYKIVRAHNGVAEIIPATRSGNFLNFNTDRFSPYGIIYTPVTSNGGGGGGGGSNPSTTPTPIPTLTPVPTEAPEHIPYIKGYPDNMFKPENKITRAEVVAMLSRLSKDFSENDSYYSNFTDVEKNEWYSNYIGFASKKGIVIGYPQGDFMPNANMTRAEFSAVIVRFANFPQLTNFNLPFEDSKGHWAVNYISTLTQKGIIDGYEDGSFRPNGYIKRAEAVKVINGVLGRTPNKEKVELNINKYNNSFSDIVKTHWAYYEMLEATIKHLVTDFH